ncbi:hypothetical protein LINPERPRIM_LOCUS36537 [Linum perenne]
MAATTSHARSNSLPSTSHPLVSEIDEQVCRLRQSQATSTSLSSISHKLNILQDVYECFDKLIQLPSTQLAMIRDQNCFNELLDGSLRLLDLCNTAKDALSETEESVSELQSAIRRRQGDLVAETKKYMNSRKIVKKAIQKALKGMESKKSTSFNNVEGIDMLRESESMVLEVLQADGKPEKGCCSIRKRTSKSREEIQAHLKNLEPCVRDLEEGVECLFRCLIKTRTSILNVHKL